MRGGEDRADCAAQRGDEGDEAVAPAGRRFAQAEELGEHDPRLGERKGKDRPDEDRGAAIRHRERGGGEPSQGKGGDMQAHHGARPIR